MQNPDVTVSVLTPSLNYARFLRDAIDSVAEQAIAVQHVVQDGGSTDGTVDLLKSDGRLDWRSEADSGQSDALNRASTRATGRWVAWLNADEYYLPGALRSLVDAGDRSGADVVHGDIVLVDEQGRFVKLRSQHGYNSFAMRRYGTHIASCAMIIRRDALPTLPWHPSLGVTMDWDLYLTLEEQGAKFHYLPYPVAAFRLHAAQVTADQDAWLADSERLRERHDLPVRSRSSVMAGLGVHRTLKVMNGAFVRQARARGLRGSDTRWFREDVGMGGARELLRRSYSAKID